MRLLAAVATSDGGPAATIWPPSSPAPGPMSITQSLAATTFISWLDHDHRVACLNQAVELRHQLVDV